jgi:ribose transport system permease protein
MADRAQSRASHASRFLANYGMFLVLLLLCGYYSCATWNEQYPSGGKAGRQLAQAVVRTQASQTRAFVVGGADAEDQQFVAEAAQALQATGITVVASASAGPPAVLTQIDRLQRTGKLPALFVASPQAARWDLWQTLPRRFPQLADAKVVSPQSYRFPDFLRPANLLAIADRIVVIAIVAIGMTMVIITGGIDLSVGSLIALSAVLATVLIRSFAGAQSASAGAMILCCLAAIALCGAVGAFSGAMVSGFRIPPFIVTLAMMLVASGLAFTLAGGQSVYQVPPSIDWLGRGTSPLGLPNTVILMVVLYTGAHLLMTRTVLGRRIYAVGGNPEAARLSGVPVAKVILFVYTACGCLAGLGGIVQASQLQSGAPTYGVMYELYVIAAVVVGGTSLAGGTGRVLGTLIGAFIIAVIQNGMNLTGVESYTQKVVMGLVILGAVLLDQLRNRGWKRSA